MRSFMSGSTPEARGLGVAVAILVVIVTVMLTGALLVGQDQGRVATLASQPPSAAPRLASPTVGVASPLPATPSATSTPSPSPGTPPPSETPTPTPSRSGAPFASSAFDILPASAPADFRSTLACTGTWGGSDPVAIVQLRGSADLVLRDYADVAHPRTVCTLGTQTLWVYSLLDSHHLIVGEAPRYAVVDLPNVRYRWFELPSPGGPWESRLIGVAPGLDRILWMSLDPEYTATDTVHLTTEAGDEVLATVPNLNTGRCGSPEDWGSAGYTRTGSYAVVLDQPFPEEASMLVIRGDTTVLSLIAASGDTAWPDGSYPDMDIWSPTSDTLYYRKGDDVWRWTPGADPELYLPGVHWLYPSFTPDGTHLAYAVQRPDGLHSVYLIDVASNGTPQQIGGGARNLPVFVNNTQLWYVTEGEGVCGPGTDRRLIYNLTDGSEAPSIIQWVDSIWPGT